MAVTGSPGIAGSARFSTAVSRPMRVTFTLVACGSHTSYWRSSVSSPIAFICAIT